MQPAAVAMNPMPVPPSVAIDVAPVAQPQPAPKKPIDYRIVALAIGLGLTGGYGLVGYFGTLATAQITAVWAALGAGLGLGGTIAISGIGLKCFADRNTLQENLEAANQAIAESGRQLQEQQKIAEEQKERAEKLDKLAKDLQALPDQLKARQAELEATLKQNENTIQTQEQQKIDLQSQITDVSSKLLALNLQNTSLSNSLDGFVSTLSKVNTGASVQAVNLSQIEKQIADHVAAFESNHKEKTDTLAKFSELGNKLLSLINQQSQLAQQWETEKASMLKNVEFSKTKLDEEQAKLAAQIKELEREKKEFADAVQADAATTKQIKAIIDSAAFKAFIAANSK